MKRGRVEKVMMKPDHYYDLILRIFDACYEWLRQQEPLEVLDKEYAKYSDYHDSKCISDDIMKAIEMA